MKLYPNLVLAVISGLQDIFNDQKQADKVIGKILKSNSKWGGRDRRFIAETTYSVVRWYRMYNEILGAKPTTTEQWWEILGIHWILSGEELPPFEEFSCLISQQIKLNYQKYYEIRKIRESIPDWLDKLGTEELKGQWDECLKNLNSKQAVNLRVNPLVTSVENCIETLSKEGIEAVTSHELALTINKRAKLTNLNSFKKGFYEVQDLGSQMIAPFLNPTPGSTVIDACAGAGGKSLHLAALMKNKGKITSLDIHDFKLKELEKRSARAGVKIITTQLIKNNKTIDKLTESADFLLLDVPCSGLGTLKRNPDAKWKLSLDFIQSIKSTQQQILSTYPSMLKKGGTMVYATCSILPSENEKQIEQFLASEKGTNFHLIKEKTILPKANSFDGFYMALLQKTR